MTLLAVLLLVAVIAIYGLRKRIGTQAAQGVTAILLVAVLLVMSLSLRRELGGGPRIVESMESAPGYVLGEAIAGANPPGGQVIAFDLAPRGEAMTRIRDARIAGLVRGLGSGQFTVVEEPPNLSENQIANLAGSLLPLRPFLDAAAKYPDAVAMVSFLGLPRNGGPGRAADLPPLYALATGDPDLTRTCIQRGVVPAAVCYRPDADWTRQPSAKDSPEEVFALYYVLVTRTNLADLDL